MKPLLFLLLFILISCNKQNKNADPDASIPQSTDTVSPKATAPDPEPPKTYSNARFREVTVEKAGKDQFRVRGEGQIFEASFSWVVEDGHNELKKGFEMTCAGAPEWGQFDFTLEVGKADPNTTLTLILFEISARDGSRQHELPITLE